jgi:hypothetical protein
VREKKDYAEEHEYIHGPCGDTAGKVEGTAGVSNKRSGYYTLLGALDLVCWAGNMAESGVVVSSVVCPGEGASTCTLLLKTRTL